MKVQHITLYQCHECRNPIWQDSINDDYAVVECLYSYCENYGKKFKLPLTILELEEIESKN